MVISPHSVSRERFRWRLDIFCEYFDLWSLYRYMYSAEINQTQRPVYTGSDSKVQKIFFYIISRILVICEVNDNYIEFEHIIRF